MAGGVVVVVVVVTWAMALLYSVLFLSIGFDGIMVGKSVDILARVGVSYFCENG